MKILITGITGMVGSHLADYLLAHHPDVEVHGLYRWRSPLDNIQHSKDRIGLHLGDLSDLGSLIRLLDEVRPERIFHLAAQSYVTTSFNAPADTLTTNVIGTTNLLEAVRLSDLDPLIHICSSSEVYGQVLKEDLPISEHAPLRPASPYAVSKVGEDMIAYQYHLSYGLGIMRTRMFTHTGPRRGAVFAESAFARQIALIEAGHQDTPVRVGNLDSVRTYADVRDAVRAYWLLLEKGQPGAVYNIGGNRTVTIGEVLEILIGMASVPITHVVDPALLRPSDVTLQVPDFSSFQNATGWTTEIDLETTLADLLDYHRQRIQRDGAL
jgi:GDP-mannose 4,6-dehydratase